MATTEVAVGSSSLRFFWWNVQSFAHFDRTRAAEAQWPRSQNEYAAKCDRIGRALRDVIGEDPPELLAFAEITNRAAAELRDRLFRQYELVSLDLHHRSQLQVAVLFSRDFGFEVQEPIVVPNVPRGTRPMAAIDYVYTGHRIRFISCHWTARFQEASRNVRSDIAKFLNSEAFSFLDSAATGERRHIVILGDLNEEPFGVVEDRLLALRTREEARRRAHYTDRDTKRVRLYNCSWRILGERRPHDGSLLPSDTAGTHFWSTERKWHTFDHVIVSGTLLEDRVPFLDESTVEAVASTHILAGEQLPIRFSWNNGNPRGLSDHLPLRGRIVLNRG